MTTSKSRLRSRGLLLVSLFLFIELVDEIVDGVTGAAWPLLREDLSLSYGDIGLLMSVPALVSYVLEPPIGLLGDVWRRFALIALGGCAFAVAMVQFAGAVDGLTLMMALILFYPASGTFVSLSQASVVDAMRGDEERAMVMWTIAGSIGVAIGPLLLAAAITAGWSWRTVYALIGAAAFTLAVLVWLARPRPARVGRADGPSAREAAREAWSMLRRGDISRWLLLLVAIDLLLEVFVSFLALYFVDIAKTSMQVGAAAVSVWTIAALAGETALIWLLRRVDGLALLRVSATCVVIVLSLFFVVTPWWAKLGLVAILGLLSAGWYSIISAQLYRAFQGRTGSVMALTAAFGPLHAVLPATVGFAAEQWGLASALWLVLVAPVALALGLRRHT